MIKLKFRYIFVLVVLFLFQCVDLNAEIIAGGWSDSKAYHPAPIVFLHGFATGSPEGWKSASDSLQSYYTKYFKPKSDDINTLPERLSRTSLYLERINFVDYDDSLDALNALIDRNSSIDTYRVGDYYVLKGRRNAGDPGWSNKVNEIVGPVLNAYRVNKVIFVCHSMGGLAAREYLRNSGISASYKVITLGTPHLGAYMASLDKGLRNTQKSGWFCSVDGWILSCLIEGLDIGLELKSQIDLDGDAAKDMTPDSNFLNTLNSSRQFYDTEFFAIVGNKPGYVGDGVVTVGSQEGQGVLQLTDKTIIKATHGEEPQVVAQGNPNPILKFIDYEMPQVEITDPNPSANPIPETTDSKINLKGKVAKEYLPADTSLQITIVKEEDDSAQVLGEDGSIKLKPSNLWNAQDPNSPVAEFDEEIAFRGPGTYIIKVIATNPAGMHSTEKTTKIKVKSLVGKYNWATPIKSKNIEIFGWSGGYEKDYFLARDRSWTNYLLATPKERPLYTGMGQIGFVNVFNETWDGPPYLKYAVSNSGERDYREFFITNIDRNSQNVEFKPTKARLIILQARHPDYNPPFDIEVYVDSDGFGVWGGGDKLSGSVNTSEAKFGNPYNIWEFGKGSYYYEIVLDINDININGYTNFELKTSLERTYNPVPVFVPSPNPQPDPQRDLFFLYYDFVFSPAYFLLIEE